MEIDKNLESCESYYVNEFGPGSDHSSPEIYAVNDDGGSPDKAMSNNIKDVVVGKNCGGASTSSRLSSPSSSNSNGHSVITFRGGQFGNFMHASGGPSLLSFDQNQGFNYPLFWEDTMQYSNNNSSGNYQNHPLTSEGSAAGPGHLVENSGSNNIPFGWLNPNTDATATAATVQEASSLTKRPYTEENIQSSKKQCTTATTKKAKTSSIIPSKDPQSIAAKNRRERISERLKTLQTLVPNGSKVDLVTTLEKAIGYVKFLQLQVKVLATDEFWPMQGGKAPDLSQVKEAIDYILASQKDRNSSSMS